MPSPGAPAPPRLPMEDSYLELLADTLESLDLPARAQFLQRYLRATTHVDLRESQSVQLWDDALVRRRELSEHLGRPVSLKTALIDVMSSAGLFRVPVVIEYEELKKLQLNAVTDPLTGLHNRRLFAETFDKELHRARRYTQPLSLVILDLHRFKEVNDTYGHPRGDEVLRAAAATLKKALRNADFAFRIGGDEFALILPQTDPAQAFALSRRVEVVFEETLRALQLAITVEMDHGIANYPQDGDQSEQLFGIADDRLYQLKHANHRKTAGGASRSAAAAVTEASRPAPPEAQPPEKTVPAPHEPISIESKRVPEPPAPESPSAPVPPRDPLAAAATAAAAGMAASPVVAAPKNFVVQRKAERVSMSGTNAYAVLGEHGARRARVVDLGFGGVALEFDAHEDLPANILAILHVPILPPVRVNLKQVWAQRTTTGSYRVGCCFVS